jgi:hypothetical protein
VLVHGTARLIPKSATKERATPSTLFRDAYSTLDGRVCNPNWNFPLTQEQHERCCFLRSGPRRRRSCQSKVWPSGTLPIVPNDRVFGQNRVMEEWLTIRCQSQLQVCDWRFGRPKSCTDRKSSGIELVRRNCYESCSRSRCQQFVADQRCSATSTRTQSGAGENACKRHLLYRCAPNARTPSRTISPNPRPRAGRRDRCHVSTRKTS